MDEYEPELGQSVFGQPTKQYAVPEIMDAALTFIRYRLGTVMWNENQREMDDPFGNSGASYKNETFEVCAYSWGDEEQPFNFKWGALEISWYKYLGRGMSSNMDISPDLASKCLQDCLKSLES